jgi:tetratricopeptide (TPR) repeat protein
MPDMMSFVHVAAPEDAAPAPVTPAPTPAPAPVTVAVDDPAPPTDFDDALAQGRALASKGDRAGATEMFQAAARLDKKRVEPHIELARLYIAGGERGLAAAAANKAVKLAPYSSLAWNTKGRADLARFAYDDALESFTKAVELDRDNVWAWNNLGFTELQLKHYDDAAVHLSEATTRKGATGYMWNNLGIALEQLDRLDEARHAFEEGGKLGSSEALASRKRLEGVKSIAVATDDGAKPESKATSEVKGYDLNEGSSDPNVELDGSGSGSGSDSADNATN